MIAAGTGFCRPVLAPLLRTNECAAIIRLCCFTAITAFNRKVRNGRKASILQTLFAIFACFAVKSF
jgi:hypothetical protein